MRMKLGTVIFLVVAAVAAGAIVTPDASGQTVLHVVLGPQEDVKVVSVDVNRDGLRLGDRIAGRGPLVDEARTERLGNAHVQCVVQRRIIDPDRGLWNCNYVLELEDGDLMLQGLDPRGPGAYEMSVLGGTGDYANASGDATFTDEDSGAGGYTDMMIRLRG